MRCSTPLTFGGRNASRKGDAGRGHAWGVVVGSFRCVWCRHLEHPSWGHCACICHTGNGAAGKIVITGAIGDYGKTVNIDQNGNTDPNGSFVKVTLQKGSFEVNATTLDKN